MSKFNPSPKTLVVNELIEQGYTVDYDDALRICHELEEEQQTHHKAAIGLTAVGIVGAGVTLAFCGAVAPLLVPIAAIGVGAMGAWNHPIRAARRDDEADFLRANPSIVQLIEAKLQSGEVPFKVAAAYLECFRAWQLTGQPLVLPVAGSNSQIAPSHPTDEELQTIGNRLCDRLKAVGKFADLEQIGQRVKAGDLKGGLKMAISANDLNAASFLDSFPGKADLYDWASDAMAAVIPTAEKELSVEEFIDTTPQGRNIESAVMQAQSGDQPRSAMKIADLSLSQRALTIRAKLEESGFQLGSILSKSVTVIAGEQRGGKGTLLAMLGILMKAFNPELKVLYFTAGSDLYPVGFDKVICADSFPGDKNPDKRVFDELYSAVMALKKYEHYEAKNFFIVVDEAIALGDSADPAKNQEMAKYLLTRFSKSGAGAAVVLHASNLSSWLGRGNTGGLAQTFKNSANFIGCGTQSIPDSTNPMRQIQIANGEYFLADPDNFGKRAAGKNSDLGKVPDFLLTRKNPHNGSPDPVRSLLTHFPELVNQNPVTVINSSSNSKVSAISLEDMDADSWGLDEPAKSDAWQSEQAIPILTTDQKFQCLTNALSTAPSLSVASIGSSLGLDRADAFQLAVVYAFRHKKTTIYDPETQSLISKVKQ